MYASREKMPISFKTLAIIFGLSITITLGLIGIQLVLNINMPPVPKMAIGTPRLAELGINFNATDSFDPDGRIQTYYWTFGDGLTAKGKEITHAYSTEGTYKLKLTVEDNKGGKTSLSHDLIILPKNLPPVINVSYPPSFFTRTNQTFDASHSTDEGEISSYTWDFGEGEPLIGPTVAKGWNKSGEYTVRLNVTDNYGATATKTFTINVINAPPTIKIKISKTTAETKDLIKFDATDSYDREGTPLTYRWDFGDKTTAAGGIVEHAFEKPGEYVTKLITTDADDINETKTIKINITGNYWPIVEAGENFSVRVFNNFIFDGTADDIDGKIVLYEWDVDGDGTYDLHSTSSGNLQYKYDETGTYTAKLRVTDNDGATATDTVTVTVREQNKSPIAMLANGPQRVKKNTNISFDASPSSDPDGEIARYEWNFGDGFKSDRKTVTHQYPSDGRYTVILTVEDNEGAKVSLSKYVIVYTTAKTESNWIKPTPVIQYSKIGDLSYEFWDTSYDTDGYIARRQWDFDGDGTFDSDTAEWVEPIKKQFTYSTPDSYAVKLLVTDDDGATKYQIKYLLVN